MNEGVWLSVIQWGATFRASLLVPQKSLKSVRIFVINKLWDQNASHLLESCTHCDLKYYPFKKKSELFFKFLHCSGVYNYKNSIDRFYGSKLSIYLERKQLSCVFMIDSVEWRVIFQTNLSVWFFLSNYFDLCMGIFMTFMLSGASTSVH